jgi:hypothetical protein
MNRDEVVGELERVRTDFRALVRGASDAELGCRSDGTRWTNRQLLFHMLFGYLIVVTLRPLVQVFAHLPRPFSRGFAGCLQALTRPFHVVNFVGSLGGGRLLGRDGMARLLDLVVARLQGSVLRATDARLGRGMHFPVAGTRTSVTT